MLYHLYPIVRMIQHKRMMPDVLHFNQLQHLIGLFSETIKALELFILILPAMLFTSVVVVFFALWLRKHVYLELFSPTYRTKPHLFCLRK